MMPLYLSFHKGKSARILFLGIIVLLLLSPLASARGDGLKIHYFNPDSNCCDLLQLQTDFDHYSSSLQAGFSLAPAPNIAQLQEHYSTGILICSRRFMKGINMQPGLISLAAARQDNSPFHRKILVGRDSLLSAEGIIGKTISFAALPGTPEKEMLSQLFAGFTGKVSRTHILTVPRDSDALLALAFHQVDGAFIELRTLQLLDKISLQIKEEISILHTSGQLPLPEIWVDPAACKKECQTSLLNFFLNMHQTPHGAQLLKRMGFDCWHKTSDMVRP